MIESVERRDARESGFGRLHGLEGMNDFMETKHVYEEIGSL